MMIAPVSSSELKRHGLPYLYSSGAYKRGKGVGEIGVDESPHGLQGFDDILITQRSCIS